MGNFWFYIQMGLEHVLDLDAYDHILFLAALAVPFTFANWKKILVLATIFTIAHCA
ncbi:MAG: HupE/UreJ family protein, partial [Arenibacter sp.]